MSEIHEGVMQKVIKYENMTQTYKHIHKAGLGSSTWSQVQVLCQVESTGVKTQGLSLKVYFLLSTTHRMSPIQGDIRSGIYFLYTTTTPDPG